MSHLLDVDIPSACRLQREHGLYCSCTDLLQVICEQKVIENAHCKLCEIVLTHENEYNEQHVEQIHKFDCCRDCFTNSVAEYLVCREKFPLCQHKITYADHDYPCNERLGVETYNKESYQNLSKSVDHHNNIQKSIQNFNRKKAGQEDFGEEYLMTLQSLTPTSTTRPCVNCSIMIKHIGGCWRMTCPVCYYSFWFPTGETWNDCSTRMRNKYKECPEYDWWNHADEIEWIPYWSQWIKKE